MQDRESYSINSGDTSISCSKQLETAIPPLKISSLSSGEFVGMVADDPDNKIELKSFVLTHLLRAKKLSQTLECLTQYFGKADRLSSTSTGIHHSRPLFKNVQFLIINRTLYAQKI